MIERMSTIVGLASLVAIVGCFGDPAPGETAASSAAAATGSTTAATTSTGAAASDGEPATSTPPVDSTSAATSEDTAAPGSTTSPGGTDASTGGEPPWVSECAEVGLTIEPTHPQASRRWQVTFDYDQALTTISLGVDGEDYPPDISTGGDCAPSCSWSWFFGGGMFPGGPFDLTVKAEGVDGTVGCTIVLE